MKRALIVTGVWVLFTLFILFMVGPVAEHARSTEVGAGLHDAQLGIGVFALVWFASLPLMGLMWIIVIFRWVLGGGKRPPPSIGYVATPQAQVFPVNSTQLPKPEPAGEKTPERKPDAGHRWLGDTK